MASEEVDVNSQLLQEIENRLRSLGVDLNSEYRQGLGRMSTRDLVKLFWELRKASEFNATTILVQAIALADMADSAVEA